jgi:hypothetical protein
MLMTDSASGKSSGPTVFLRGRAITGLSVLASGEGNSDKCAHQLGITAPEIIASAQAL